MAVFKSKKKKLSVPSTVYVVKHEQMLNGIAMETWLTVHETLSDVAGEIKDGELFAEYHLDSTRKLVVNDEIEENF